MQVALGEFWMLHGFRPLVEVARDVARTPELGRLLPELISLDAAIRWSSPREPVVRSALFARLMALPQDEVDRALATLLARLRPAYERGGLDKSSPDFWAARASQQFPLPGGRVDRGIVSIYLLNLVRLEAGDATFIPAGVLHAYLEGRNVELMAASDNVLRGGLTPKHVDVAELSRILTFEATTPARLVPQGSPGFSAFRAPVEEFALERWELPSGARTAARRDPGPTTLLVLEGRVTLSWGADAGRGAPTVQSGSPDLTHPSAARTTARNATMTLERGGAVLVPASLRYQLHARADSVVFAATVPPRAAQNRS
jgi:mannose-6-phosphate isomerase